MPNDYFRFKQFLIKQDKCAMKVCTDACLFGAWVAAHCSQLTIHSLLDIGTGTGLLSLMFAQKFSYIKINAVEIDNAAAQQAYENFKTSIFNSRIKVYNNSIQQFEKLCLEKFDVIISNPPFYEDDLKSENKERNIALHSNELSLSELVAVAAKLLTANGNFFVMLPFYRRQFFEELLLKNNLRSRKKLFIKQTPKHNYFRIIFWVDRFTTAAEQTDIIITDEDKMYSNDFVNLLKDYYLYL